MFEYLHKINTILSSSRRLDDAILSTQFLRLNGKAISLSELHQRFSFFDEVGNIIPTLMDYSLENSRMEINLDENNIIAIDDKRSRAVQKLISKFNYPIRTKLIISSVHAYLHQKILEQQQSTIAAIADANEEEQRKSVDKLQQIGDDIATAMMHIDWINTVYSAENGFCIVKANQNPTIEVYVMGKLVNQGMLSYMGYSNTPTLLQILQTFPMNTSDQSPLILLNNIPDNLGEKDSQPVFKVALSPLYNLGCFSSVTANEFILPISQISKLRFKIISVFFGGKEYQLADKHVQYNLLAEAYHATRYLTLRPEAHHLGFNDHLVFNRHVEFAHKQFFANENPESKLAKVFHENPILYRLPASPGHEMNQFASPLREVDYSSGGTPYCFAFEEVPAPDSSYATVHALLPSGGSARAPQEEVSATTSEPQHLAAALGREAAEVAKNRKEVDTGPSTSPR